MSLADLFGIVRNCKQPKCLSTCEWIDNLCTFIQWNITRQLKKWTIDIHYSLDDSQNIYILSDEDRQKGTYAVWFNLYKILGNGN